MIELIGEYFKQLDESIDILSNKVEGNLANLPAWVLNNREIRIAQVENSNFILVAASPKVELEEDQITFSVITTDEELKNFHAPLWYKENASIKHVPNKNYSFEFAEFKVIEANNINAIPVFHDNSKRSELTLDLLPEVFSKETARKDALDMWNNTFNELPVDKSFVNNLQNIFNRFRSIIKRKSFLERRVHRYINEYSTYLLPSHIEKHFEHPLYLDGEERRADFILQRESSFPALLIELENPSVRIFRKNGEPTSETNHAKNQIAEWVKFIERNSDNQQGDYEFLSGPKDRLVIIGRGMEFERQMKESRYSDTLIWSYDFLIEEMKRKWNKEIEAQCKILGIENINLIK